MAAFVWGEGGAQMTPTEIEAQRKVAQAMMAKGMDFSPVASPWQGAARVAQAMMGGLESRQADTAAKANQEAESQLLTSIIGGGTPSASSVSTAPASPVTSAPLPSIGSTAPDSGLSDAITKVASARGVDPAYMTRLAMVESGGNPNATTSLSSAKGPFQFIDSTAQHYGLTNPTDTAASADAAARLTLDNKAALTQALGREPTPGELYLAHQQGAAGAAKILANPDAPIESVIGTRAAANNGAVPGMTAGQFANKWTSRFSDIGAPQVAQADPAALPANSHPAQGFAVPGATPPATSVNPALARAIASPYTSEGTKKILSLILTQQMSAAQKANDPLHQLQIQEARSKLTPFDAPFVDDRGNLVQRDALGKVTVLNPADKAPSTVGEYKFYADQETKAGRTPLPFGQWDIARRRSAATNVNTGTIPQGYQQVQDPVTGAISLQPLPGGPHDTSKKDQAKAESQATSTDVITNAATNIRDAIKSSNLPATGTAGAVLSNIGETGAAEVARQMAVLKSNATIENLNAMRQQSPTGGALGNVTEGEGAMLAAKAGALDMKSPHFMRDLADYERTLLRTIHGKAAGDKIFDATRKPETQPQAPAEGATAVNPQTGERLIRKGGKWVPFT